MKSQVRIKKTIVHSEHFLAGCLDNNGTLQIRFNDVQTDEFVSFEMSYDEAKKLSERLQLFLDGKTV